MKYQSVNENNPRAMRLIEMGLVLGTPASEIKVGDFLMWNYGYTSQVNSIIRETAKTLTISVTETKSQKIFERKLHKNRLVCLLSK
ncbi:hypothetical protein UFOVP457_47 [uncultured Caudovirales phage]|uniref:Uncharacterized protein n=1 Tax=uncultured Caudovirales phage TaxID=2100421 RepID=A0A6J5ME02_9CAUD|nr:hypothetical protein UFOVP457_47 [uncultured Caudovirales phage]